ncbi:MAG: SDR family oxidoreductase [Actinomycetota bacterium]|nr:SDR family oxidoreductase [Actinomycetota bacterium]
MAIGDEDLAGQTALITGASRGIGEAIGWALGRRGAHVVLTSRTPADTHALATRMTEKGLTATGLELDVRDEHDVAAVVAQVAGTLGGIQILVNNAGTSGPPAPVWETSTEFFDDMLRVHLMGTFFCVRAVVPHMLTAGYGRIVNVVSVAGKEGNPQKGAYSAAKAGVIGLTKSLAKELATSGILANAVAPTVVETDLLAQSTPEHVAMLTAKIPMGRRGTPLEVAEMVAWAASPRCSFTTGAVFDVSGGRMTY